MWLRIKAFFKHSRTIFAARMLQLAGIILVLADWLMPFVVDQDWTPVTNLVLGRIPAEFRPLVVGLAIAAVGRGFERLRTLTTLPLSAKGQP